MALPHENHDLNKLTAAGQSVLASSTLPTLEGKTYSLRFAEPTSDSYFQSISRLADACLSQTSSAAELLFQVQNLSKSRRRLRKLKQQGLVSADSRLAQLLTDHLSQFTPGVQAHLRGLRVLDRWDRSLSTSEEQYHLNMLEIELINRIYGEHFKASSRKLAFLPHCLRDLEADCRAAQRDLDYVCKGCTDGCNVNSTSKMLRRHGVKPYIWMTADLRSIFRKARKEGNSLGVLGIACIPELVRGMRMCLKNEVPVVGVPLDANRCARWWGEFRWNTVNLRQLESLMQ